MCIYYLISFTKSIYFLLNFQIPFMFWIIILPLNILYYPTKESIRFSNNLIFLTVLRFWAGFGSCFGDFCCFSYFFSAFFRLFGLIWGAVLGISAVSTTFFSAFFRLFGWVWGAVLGISAVSATFSRLFSGFLAGFWELFWGFLQFQLLFAGFFPAFGLSLGCFFSTSSVRSLNCLF